VHEQVLGDFIRIGVLEIKGGVFLNEMGIIGEVAMNDGIK